MLAHLQRAHVSDNCPPVLGWNLAGVGRHRAVTFANHSKQPANRRLPQSRNVIRRGTRVASLDNLAMPGPQLVVASNAVNLKAIPAVVEQLLIDSDRKLADKIAILIFLVSGLSIGCGEL